MHNVSDSIGHNATSELDKLCTLEIDPAEFEAFANTHRKEATVKWYHPRPFLNNMTNEQAINANWIGYNEHNTTESNWGLDTEHNKQLKEMVGNHNFDALGIDPKKSDQQIKIATVPPNPLGKKVLLKKIAQYCLA